MSSLTLISGSISEARDPLFKFDPSEIFYIFMEQDKEDPNGVTYRCEDLPMSLDGKHIEIIQDLGSGKTLKAIDMLARKECMGGKCYANLGLAWNPQNADKPKEEWKPDLNSLDDLSKYNDCTILIDDIYGTIQQWNTEAAKIVALVANERRKMRKDIIITAQREVMIPPGLREMCTEWIIPVITMRDFTRESPDGTGYPVELRTIHFNGAKVFKYISPPMINLKNVFKAYSTLETAVHLSNTDAEGIRTNQPGYALECKIKMAISKMIPGVPITQFNGKRYFDLLIGNELAIDAKGNTAGSLNTSGPEDLWINKLHEASRNHWTPYIVYETGKDISATLIKKDLPTQKNILLGSHAMFRRVIPIEKILKRMFPGEYIETSKTNIHDECVRTMP